MIPLETAFLAILVINFANLFSLVGLILGEVVVIIVT